MRGCQCHHEHVFLEGSEIGTAQDEQAGARPVSAGAHQGKGNEHGQNKLFFQGRESQAVETWGICNRIHGASPGRDSVL